MFVHPAHRPGSETDVLGRRIAATVLDTGVVFVLYYALLLIVSGAIQFGVGRAIDFFPIT